MTRTRLHKQARLNTCAVASLRTVLDVQLGVKVSEMVLEAHGDEANHPITVHGTSTTQLRAMVKGVDRTHNTSARTWRLRCHVHGSIRDLVRELVAGRLPLIRVYEDCEDLPGYHMIVLLGFENGSVKLFDPDPTQANEPFWMSADEFVAWWGDDNETTWYAVINTD